MFFMSVLMLKKEIKINFRDKNMKIYYASNKCLSYEILSLFSYFQYICKFSTGNLSDFVFLLRTSEKH